MKILVHFHMHSGVTIDMLIENNEKDSIDLHMPYPTFAVEKLESFKLENSLQLAGSSQVFYINLERVEAITLSAA